MRIAPRATAAALLGALLLTGAAGCQTAAADEEPADGTSTSGEPEVPKNVGDLYYISRAEDGTSKLLRWNGDEGGKVETVKEGDALMYDTINLSSYGDYLGWASTDNDGAFVLESIEDDAQNTMDGIEADGDSCFVPDWAPGGSPSLVANRDDKSAIIHGTTDDEASDPIAVNDICDLQLASGSMADALDVFYFNRDTKDIEFSSYGEITETGVGAAVQKELSAEVVGLSATSPNGSEICVALKDGNNPADANRRLSCDAVVDTATGDIYKQATKDGLQIQWYDGGLVMREDNAIHYFDAASDLGSDPELSIREPAELADAELLTVTTTYTTYE